MLRLGLLAAVMMVAGCSSPASEKAEASVPAVKQKKFNLRCTGDTKTFPKNGAESTSAFGDVFPIDLDAGTWCRGKCEAIFDISRVQEGELLLGGQDGMTEGVSIRVNRVTGAYREDFRSDVLNAYTTGQCVKEPFTGFPERQF